MRLLLSQQSRLDWQRRKLVQRTEQPPAQQAIEPKGVWGLLGPCPYVEGPEKFLPNFIGDTIHGVDVVDRNPLHHDYG